MLSTHVLSLVGITSIAAVGGAGGKTDEDVSETTAAAAEGGEGSALDEDTAACCDEEGCDEDCDERLKFSLIADDVPALAPVAPVVVELVLPLLTL